MRKITGKYKKYIWLALIVLVLVIPFGLIHAQEALPAAGTPSPTAPKGGCGILPDWFCHPIAFLANAIGSWFIYIGSFFGMILAWAVGWILAFGQNIVNSPPVQSGFGVTLAIANMGFVLVIIVIAISTILRIERYGIKTLLAKVIMAAVLVNFGLVLSGVVLNFSDSVTNYFLQGVAGTNNSSNPVEAFTAFRDKMVGAFQPQKLVNPNKADIDQAAAAKSLTGLAGGADGPSMNLFVSMLMSIIGVILVLITLATFVIMLAIRYVTLVILLVLLPLAWMAAVFPGLSQHFSKWLSKFIEQLIFPPVALFFLWLAMTISGKTILLGGNDKLVSALNQTNPIAASIISPLFSVVVLSALMLGGLMVAKNLGAAGADTGLKWAKGTGNWAKGKVGRGAANVGARALRTSPFQKMAQNLQKVGSGTGPLGRLGGYAARATGTAFLAEKLGRGMDAGARGGELNYKYYSDRASKLDAGQIANRIPQSRGAELAALLAEAQKRKGVLTSDLVSRIPKNEMLGQEDWTRYGNSKGFSETETRAGSQTMRDAQNEMKGAKNATELAKATANFKAAADEFIAKMEKDDAAKYEWKAMLSEKDLAGNPRTQADLDAQYALIQSLADNKPGLIGTVNSKLGGKEKERLVGEINTYYEFQMEQTSPTADNDPVAFKKAKDAQEKMQKSMGSVAELIEAFEAAQKTAASPSPAPAAAAAPKP
jgi:hypothetical protein